MTINKVVTDFGEAVADISDEATIMIGGFGGPGGCPQNLIKALRDKGTKNLTIIGCAPVMSDVTAGTALRVLPYIDCSILIETKQIRKIIASAPFYGVIAGRVGAVDKAYLAGEIEVEVVPQGTLIERIRAGGAGIGGFYTPTGVGTPAEYVIGGYYTRGELPTHGKKEKRIIDGREYLLEFPLRSDYAFVWAFRADKLGNLVYRRTARSFSHPVATAARVTIAEVEEIVEPGELDPDHIHTPAVYVDKIVKIVKK